MSLHSTTDQFIEDIIKAAKESFARSPRRQPGETLHIQTRGDSGQKLAEVFVHHEGKTYWADRETAAKLVAKGGVIDEKLSAKNHQTSKHANHAGLGSLAGGLMLPGLGAPIGAALGADEGQRGTAAIGSVLGGVGGAGLGAAGGGGLGALLGALAHNPGLGAQLGAGVGAGVGGLGGMMYGAQKGGHKDSIADKLANHAHAAGLGGALGATIGDIAALTGHSGFGAMSAAPLGAAMGADEGNRLQAAGGALAGSVGGGMLGDVAGGGLAKLLHLNPQMGNQIGRSVGRATGAAYGAQLGNDKLGEARDKGARAAATRFDIKEAFIGPLLGSLAGPALARAGVGALAKGVGGAALGSMAGKVLPRIGGGMGGLAFDAATSMAGGALGNKLQPQGPMG